MFVLNTLEVEESIYFFKVWFTKIILMSISTGFVIADFDSFKKQRESKSAKPIKQLRQQSLFQVFCTYVVQRNFNPTTLLSHSQASLVFYDIYFGLDPASQFSMKTIDPSAHNYFVLRLNFLVSQPALVMKFSLKQWFIVGCSICFVMKLLLFLGGFDNSSIKSFRFRSSLFVGIFSKIRVLTGRHEKHC